MKLETRIETAILLVAALAVGTYVGYRLVSGGEDQPEAPAPSPVTVVDDDAVTPTAPRIMTAPPLEHPQTPTAPAPATPREIPTQIVPPPPPPDRDPVGELMASQNRKTAAEQVVEKVEGAIEPAMTKALGLVKAGNKYEARAVLTKALLNTPRGAARAQIKETLDEINRELFFSRAPSPDAKYYTIEAGDSLAVIAKRFEKDYYFHELIMMVNNIRDAKRIQVGQSLKIPVGRFSARVDKSENAMIVFLDGHYIKEYAVGLGAPESPTPTGTFVVANSKQVNPSWTTPDGRVLKFGDPRNILGTRWIGLKETDQHRGYGIHGTSNESTIGRNVSNGCIRMRNADVEEVFGMLMPGDAVEIVE